MCVHIFVCLLLERKFNFIVHKLRTCQCTALSTKEDSSAMFGRLGDVKPIPLPKCMAKWKMKIVFEYLCHWCISWRIESMFLGSCLFFTARIVIV